MQFIKNDFIDLFFIRPNKSSACLAFRANSLALALVNFLALSAVLLDCLLTVLQDGVVLGRGDVRQHGHVRSPGAPD